MTLFGQNELVQTAPPWVFSAFAFVSFVLVSIPLPWHLQAWNTGTCLYMVWTALACLNAFINSIIWSDNAINWAPVWCDISSHFMIGSSVAIPAASLCINRRLYIIASVQRVTTTKAEKRRGIIVDLSIGLGIPLFAMILQYFCQGHRFNIYEELGCFPDTYLTPLAFPLVFCIPVIIGLISGVYCCLTIRCLAKRRSEFQQLLSGNKNLSSSRYFRLMGLAGTELLLTVPLGCWAIYLNASNPDGIQPYLGWADTHYNFSYVGQYPSLQWKTNRTTVTGIMVSRWSIIFCALIFFGFFGFADEARKNYKLAFQSVAKKVGYTTAEMSSGGSGSFGSKQMTSSSMKGTLPVFIRQETTSKRDSVASFSTNITLGDVGGTLDDIKTPYSPTNTTSSASSRHSFDEKRTSLVPESPIQRPESTLDAATPPRHSADTPAVPRPDSMTIV